MSGYNKKGRYLSAEMRFKYNPKTQAIDVTTGDDDLAEGGFIFTIPTSSKPGQKIMGLLYENDPHLRDNMSSQRFDAFGTQIHRDKDQLPQHSTLIPLGIDSMSREVVWNVLKDNNCVFTGRAGTGKTAAQQAVIEYLSQFPDQWQIYAYEPFGAFSGKGHLFPNLQVITGHSYTSFEDSLQNLINLLAGVYKTVESRIREINKADVRVFASINQPRIMVVLDDVDHLLNGESVSNEKGRALLNRLRDLLLLISHIGPSAGVHFMLGLHNAALTQESGFLKDSFLAVNFAIDRREMLRPEQEHAYGTYGFYMASNLPTGAALIRGAGTSDMFGSPVMTQTYSGDPEIWFAR